MLRRRLLTYLTAVLLIAGVGFGVTRLIGLRLEKGDVYPPASTLRADPVGGKALFDALDAMPQREVRRNFRPLRELRPNAPVTLIYAGVARHAEWGRDELKHFESLIANGSRAVFAFAPASLEPEKKRDKKSEEDKTKRDSGKVDNAAKEDPGAEKKEESGKTPAFLMPHTVPFPEVAQRWGASFEVMKGKKAGSFHGLAKVVEETGRLEPEVSWHSALRFSDLAPGWRVVYRVMGQPVIIERQWGDGTIVLASDAFFLSNEALQTEPSPGLVSWLLGSPGTVIFDEEHLGVSESTGIVSLVRKYRLQGGLAALAIVAILWFWMETSPLIPAHSKLRPEEEYVTGLDSQEGFVSLLRRTISPSRVFEVCVNEWRKTFAHDPRSLSTMDQALLSQNASELRPKDSAAAYRDVAAAMHASTTSKAPTASLQSR